MGGAEPAVNRINSFELLDSSYLAKAGPPFGLVVATAARMLCVDAFEPFWSL
jgi:hypothetical protein